MGYTAEKGTQQVMHWTEQDRIRRTGLYAVASLGLNTILAAVRETQAVCRNALTD